MANNELDWMRVEGEIQYTKAILVHLIMGKLVNILDYSLISSVRLVITWQFCAQDV